jgi:Ca-activated chloride channel family protein
LSLPKWSLAATVLAAILIIPAEILSQQTPDDELRIDSSIVILNAVVTDQTGEIRRRLNINDFTLQEDGVSQQIDFVEAETTPFAAAILLDVSGSMETRVSLARSAAIRFLSGLRPEDSAAIFSFDDKVVKLQDFSNSKDVTSKVFDLKASGDTSLYTAIKMAAEELSTRPEKRRAIVVLSDGEDTQSRISDSKALRAAQNANATVYTVDMSSIDDKRTQRRQNLRVLKNFASETGGLFVKTPGGVQLRNAFANIVEELGVLYTLGYYSKNESKNGKWRRIDLKTSNPTDSVRTREGYYAMPD